MDSLVSLESYRKHGILLFVFRRFLFVKGLLLVRSKLCSNWLDVLVE